MIDTLCSTRTRIIEYCKPMSSTIVGTTLSFMQKNRLHVATRNSQRKPDVKQTKRIITTTSCNHHLASTVILIIIILEPSRECLAYASMKAEKIAAWCDTVLLFCRCDIKKRTSFRQSPLSSHNNLRLVIIFSANETIKNNNQHHQESCISPMLSCPCLHKMLMMVWKTPPADEEEESEEASSFDFKENSKAMFTDVCNASPKLVRHFSRDALVKGLKKHGCGEV
jgi:hypothetical protein